MPMPSPTPSSFPPLELTRKIRRTLFPGVEDELPEPMPASLHGRLLWAGDILLNWAILVLAIVNLTLVLFDFTYLELRPHYLKYAPAVVERYDPVKGVEKHNTTEAYLAAAHQAFAGLKLAPASPGTRQAIAEMQARSMTMVQEDPFSGAGLSGVFEQIKNRFRSHMHLESAKQAMTAYWTPENLSPSRLAAEEAFFRGTIEPLVGRNYYRGIGENGRPFDAFWMIDALFLPFFALEFLLRGAVGVRRGKFPSWKAFCMKRWYDLVYFIPLGVYFVPMATMGPWHLVRVISVGYRMQRLGLINPVAHAQRQVSRGVNLVTDVVNVKLLSNYQDSVRRFDLEATLEGLTPAQREQMSRFIDRNLTMLLSQVLPEVQPQLEALIARAAHQALEQSSAYQSLKRIPGFGLLPQSTIPTLVAEVVSGTQAGLLHTLSDPESRKLTEEAISKFSFALLHHMASTGTEEDVKAMLIDALEQQKRKLLA